MSDYRHQVSSQSQSPEPPQAGSAAVMVAPGYENDSTWRKIDSTSRHFSETERFSGILGESLNLSENRQSYLIYCNQKDLSRPDKVKLVSCVLKGPALNFWMEKLKVNNLLLILVLCSRQWKIGLIHLLINVKLSGWLNPWKRFGRNFTATALQLCVICSMKWLISMSCFQR